MRCLVPFAILLLAPCALAAPPAPRHAPIEGAWQCGPFDVHRPDFDLAVTREPAYKPDRTYMMVTTSVLTARGKPPVTRKDLAVGTWHLDDDVITIRIEWVQAMMPSADPSHGGRFDEFPQDTRLKEKTNYRLRIVGREGDLLQTLPVEPEDAVTAPASPCTLRVAYGHDVPG